jgi:serine/threonine protein kinase
MEEEDPLGGQVLDGYRLVRFLGRGGFGEVWLCQSEAMGSYHALKFIARANHEVSEREYQALTLYRTASGMLRSPHLVPIEHINRNATGLYYVMPLADGIVAGDPVDPAWQPLSLAARIHAQAAHPAWFSSAEITATLCPLLHALQTLSDAGLVHRDVKPENILFLNGQPCLGDISLLGADASVITRRGTPGYATPSWYVGGHPDMYGIAATLYTLLTGNSPDRMGRSAFLWPPQGKSSLADAERDEWKRLHRIIRRATDEKVSERFVDFAAMAHTISGASGNEQPASPRLPRILWSALAVAGIAAAILVAGFRSKQPDPAHPPAIDRTVNDPVPELTADQKADYRALAGMIQGYIGNGEYANALASVETLLATYPQARTQPAYSIARAMALRGLGRLDEAKEELKKDIHLSPSITAMAGRKDLWEQLGDLAEAEKDLTRILEKFGPNTFVLFLRADVRAKRGNFAGVVADQQAAYAYKPEEPEQRGLVDDMWAPLETKYPGYGNYLKNQQGEGRRASPEGKNEAQPAQ